MRVLQAFTRERAATENFRRVSEAYRQRNQETVVQNAVYFPFVDFLSSLATAIILGYGAYLVFDGQTTIGVLTAFLGYATTFFASAALILGIRAGRGRAAHGEAPRLPRVSQASSSGRRRRRRRGITRRNR